LNSAVTARVKVTQASQALHVNVTKQTVRRMLYIAVISVGYELAKLHRVGL